MSAPRPPGRPPRPPRPTDRAPSERNSSERATANRVPTDTGPSDPWADAERARQGGARRDPRGDSQRGAPRDGPRGAPRDAPRDGPHDGPHDGQRDGQRPSGARPRYAESAPGAPLNAEPDDAPGTLHYFAPCPRGLEHILADELRALGARVDAMSAAGVAFSGDRAVGYEANLRSRIASRVLRRVGMARYRGDDDLYRLANRCEWERWFDASMTMRVDVSAVRSPLRSLNFVTLRIKDGIVDRFRNATGDRPSIDTVHPVVRIQAFLKEDVATLYLDLSGEPLFKRGWRSERDDKGEAPLKENLAAGLLALAGWKPGTPLYDPFCGSGTVLIEAAQIACRIPPGLSRHFGFESLLDHDEKLWNELRSRAHREVRAADSGLFAGSDADPLAIEQTRRNAQHAGLPEGLIALELRDVTAARSPFPGTGTIVTNPPYGERLELSGTPNPNDGWTEIGSVLRKQFGGWRVFVLTTDLQLPELLGMKEKRRAPLYNGALECRLFGFEIFWPREAAPT